MTARIKAIIASVVTTGVLVAVPASVGATEWHHGHGNHHYEWTPNLVEKAVEINKETGEFSTLIAAVSCTDVAHRLSKDWRKFTVFAPTDAAFAKAGLTADNVCTTFDKATLTDILEFHVTRGYKDSGEVLSRKKLRMLNGDKAVISGATIDGVNIVQTDVWTRNGIIHVVDGVMLP